MQLLSLLFIISSLASSNGYALQSLRMSSTSSGNPFTAWLGGLTGAKAAPKTPVQQTVLITGASGLLGTELSKRLESRSFIVKKLTTKQPKDESEIFWDPTDSNLEVSDIEGVDVVVHLAGENIASGSTESPLNILGRWSDAKKSKIIESRAAGTRLLVTSLEKLKRKPKVLVSASAVGFYGFTDLTTVFDESSPRGEGFLADVCQVWESEALKYSRSGRTVCTRFGVILSNKGGVLAKLKRLFNLAAGGNIGSGLQGFPWVSVDDAVRAIEFAIDTPSLSGAINVVAPSVTTNADFTKALGGALGRPTIFPAPEFIIKLVLGQFGEEVLLGGQKVFPEKLTNAGFEFNDKEIDDAVKRIVA